ncbi:virion structural protein [Cyanophage S-TIM4]|uniref:Structural protein n=1 Tax=Cyanophage S-TIM4 TaxID=1048189 RepID=A0A345AWF4_9CAUD|nr:virion structural protein [Cyanophage S-TIM4]AXF41237.1 structural protein [Cyanophage S-TIM4]
MNINKVSQSVVSQTPDFIGNDYPLFNKFIEYYYRSQEKTGLGQNIVNEFLQYLDIDKLNIDILDGATKLVESTTTTADEIVVESIDSFLTKDGSVLIGNEVVYYESTTASPNIALSPGISYEQVKLKWTTLASLLDSFDGTTVRFNLTSQDSPVAAPSAQHLIVSLYGKILTPGIDYTVDGTAIVFTTAPRTRIPADDSTSTYITYQSGFVENTIVEIDNLSGSFGEGKRQFTMTRNGSPYEPVVGEYVLAIYDQRLLVPKVDFFIDKDQFIFLTAPLNGRFLSLYSIEAPIPSFGSGALGYSRVDDNGTLTSVSVKENGSNYRFEYPPKVTINSAAGSGASVTALVNGIKTLSLLEGGKGYSDTNPPVVQVQSPTKPGSVAATLKATVTNGSVSGIEVISSGSGYTFTPRITFKQPGGAILGTCPIVGGQVSGTIPITDGGFGYTTVPTIYIDEPTGTNPIRATLTPVLTDGVITSITITNAGQGYITTPRISVVDPVGAQVLSTTVDSNGRLVGIELLDGGSGYDDVPSVYVVDNRVDATGAYAGGTGATATAAIFNGRITDINITAFGSGYSAANPPEIVIQAPPQAKASATVGLNEVTGFKVNQSGKGYSKSKLVGCARAASGITSYTEDGNAVFTNNTTAAAHAINSDVKCLDALFVKRLLDKYTEQFLPDVPELDYKKIDVRTAIKTIKDFYTAKGTSFSISYLFKLLYGEQVSITYPKDQIIKPSAATWSIDTILRATLVSGDPTNIRDGLLTQDADIADVNVAAASALIENYISIKTSDVEIFELVLSEETITGSFTVPYKTKLAEPLGTEDSIITVDSTIGWPERNGEFLIGNSEVVRYKEKSLNQFIECTRSVNNIVEDWDSATEVASNFSVFVNKGTPQEVVMKIVGIVDAQQTTLTDTGSYYLPGDKLTVSKLGGTGTNAELTTWLYNVKKLINISSITFGGVNNQSATVTCANNHGLLVGDQVTIYGANPIIYNGTFLVTSRDSNTVFQYQLPQPATVVPQGNILVSVDLNKGKSDDTAVLNSIGPYTTNIQNSFFNNNYVYVASTGIPNYKIGPFPGSALLPGNQRKLNRFPLAVTTISTKNNISPGPIGTWVNGVSIWSYKSTIKKTFGAVTDITISNAGSGYDAASPPNITISGGGGTGATSSVTVNGSVNEITVTAGGSGYTSSPLVSIAGGGGSGASATAIITKGVVSRVLINDGGTGYTSQPTITIVGGGGTGATGTASVRGPIQDVTVSNGGASYTSNPTVTLSSGSGAVAQAIVQNGRIISIAIISAGSGYTTAPTIDIQGEGFGAVARATIDVDGENAGRVTGIEIVNRGIGYIQGTTLINLNSVGSGATFTANVFQWTYNLQETSTLDAAKGGVFEGFNNQYGGEYAHLSNPQRLRYLLGDNLFENNAGLVKEQETQLAHSPIIGWAFDGNPIYGPYGYSDPTDQNSAIAKLNTSYQLKAELVYNAVTNQNPVRTAGPLLSEESAGRFVEDYQYVFGQGDLDQYNGRFCKTPDYPDGRYCYFVTIDSTEDGNPLFPYVLGPSFNSVVDTWNLSADAVQQNIPTGVVRYRDPYENVDIDVERAPNASTNAITLENGDILLFEVEDEDRSGIIDQDETDDPDQVFEESPLQLFDYFPKVKLDSKVDIEVETITKFEDASVTGFTIENAGVSYQVNDRLVFDNTDTDGSGVSARVSRIKGESVLTYGFENTSGINYGLLKTTNPHNLVAGDTVFVDYSPVMDNTNKSYIVRQYKGIEEIQIDQTGSGYNTDIPPTIIIDGNGSDGSLEAVVTSVGSIDTVNILNSGSGYTSNPRVILSHPQVFKKADYYVSLIENENYASVNDVYVNDNKEVYICGKTHDISDNLVAFVAKLSATGVKEWEATLELTGGLDDAEFQKLYVDGKDIWVAGRNYPNSSLLNAYNPDIILVKYVEAENGLSATLNFQRAYAGISGSTRSDEITALKKFSDTRFVIGGYTNTNSANPYDAFIALVDTTGTFAIKRKLTSANSSEKITDIVVNGSDVYFSMEIASSVSATAVDVGFGKATIGTSAITIPYIKQISNTVYSFLNTSIAMDEFDEAYITATTRLKSDNTTTTGFWVGKFNTTGDVIYNKRYAVAGGSITAASKCVIDIFGDLNVAVSKIATTDSVRTAECIKIGYNGIIKSHTTQQFNLNNIEGITVNSLAVDNSGDVHLFGQTSWNRNEFIFPFTSGSNADTTGHYTLTSTSTNNSITYADNVAKIYGYNPAGSNSTWVNSHLKITSAQLGTKLNENWTIEFGLYKEASSSQTLSQTQQTLVSIGDAEDATGGLWLYYDVSSGKLELVVTNNTTKLNSAGSALQSTLTTMFADNTWQYIGLKKEGNQFTAYVNGIQAFTGSVSNTALNGKDLLFGQITGRDGTAGTIRKNEQGQYFIDHLRLRNRAITPSVPSDVTAFPTTGAFAFAYTWVDSGWFTTNLSKYDYIDYIGWGLKIDKNADAARIGTQTVQTNTQVGFVRTSVSAVTGVDLTVTNTGFALGDAGFQNLDFDDSATTMNAGTESLTYKQDIWSSRTATVPSPGSRKLKVTAIVRDRYYFKVTPTSKIDNIQELTINQSFNFTVGTKLKLVNATSGAFINSGYIISTDNVNNKIFLSVNNNGWSDDLNQGQLVTEQFSEQSTYGIVGPIPADVNEIEGYNFAQVNNTTPGTFDIDLDKYNLDGTYNAAGGQNLDSFAKFKPHSDIDYAIRIDEVSPSGSPFIVGSVVTITSSDISFNSAYSTAQITNLTGVLKITVIANLTKILQVTAVTNSDQVYVITGTNHYLSTGSMIYVDGNPTQTIGSTTYDEYDGSFAVSQIVSAREFVYKLPSAALTSPATTAANVSIYVKSPVLKMYYGHQYLFDVSHSSMSGGNLSFSKDPLNKLEYSFNSIERVGTPGLTGAGNPTPTVKLKVDEGIVTNISYYFDPSRTGADSPVSDGSYLDVTDSPYKGTFSVQSVQGATITRGADIIRFPLLNEPEAAADVNQASYTTSSVKAVGSIGAIRIVNPGGFYTRLPVVTGIQSTRQIERVAINAPGTEYAVGTYTGVPIGGDGEGGFVEITVADGTDANGVTIPGQIQSVVVTSPGKNYTTATIDVEAITGILGSGLTGSGAELEVVIPASGTGASIFTQGDKVGKIKKLKNNNFGYDYPHDYTLRPEITFPINAQLTSTSILDSITVTDPGSGYSQAPAVVITGGGGTGAVAEATIKNGRLDLIIVKDPGAGYSSTPAVALRSSFNYVVNLDLGLLQFAFPHGIANGSAVTLNVVDTGEGADFPLAAGAIGRLNGTTTYYAITGSANSLEPDQLKLAITASNANLGDAISYVNAGSGRQQLLTESFGGAATANVITSTFLEGELVYQGDSLENSTAQGYVSTNNGWQIGPRVLKIVDYTGDFIEGQRVTGVISKSSGTISDLNIAKGVLEIGSLTKTTGQFIDDVGKPSEIIEKIQDSYYYQDFSYAIKSAVSIGEWKDILIKNVHPASFKVFGELNLSDYGFVPNKETDFQLTKSVELARDAIVPNIQSFALVEPVYSEFNNTEILFRQKRLTSSENILTSVVQRIDDISTLFDGERIAFPLTVGGTNIVANANQLMIVLNGVVQNPGTSFNLQGDSIVFNEPPQPPASIKYVNVTIQNIPTKKISFDNIGGIFPNPGNEMVGTASGNRLTVTSVVGNDVFGFFTQGTTFTPSELVTVGATGFASNVAASNGVTDVQNIGLFTFGEKVTDFQGDTARVESINLQKGQETPLAQLRYTIGPSTTSFEVVAYKTDNSVADAPVADGTFTTGQNYQFGSEIFLLNSITQGSQSTTFGVTRAQSGTTAVSQQEDNPVYGTQISVNNQLTLSKTTGTYQSTPGLYDIQLNEVIIGAQSGVVARVTATSTYQDPVTQEFISQVNISEGSSFFGLLFNRITSQTYPNVVLDDISKSQVRIVDFTDNQTDYNTKFPSNEEINNYVIPYDNASGTLQNETIRNYKLEYGNNDGEFATGEGAVVRKLTYRDTVGTGLFVPGQIIRTRDTKAEVIGANQARKTVYVGKVGRSLRNGGDYHTFTFNNAYLNATNQKFGDACLGLSPGTEAHTFVSGVADSITAGGGATGTFTAATGTTYNGLTGDLVIEIGNHSLTTSNTVLIADNSIGFTCAQDGNTSTKTYPRSTDPASGSARNITAVTSTTITVNVGAVPIDESFAVAASDEFGFGTAAFTIECWIRPITVGAGTRSIFDFRTAATEVAPYLYLDGANLEYYVNGSIVIQGTANIVANQWTHVAISKSGSVTRMFVNGVQDGSNYSDSNNYGTNKPIRIGDDTAGNNHFIGYIDEFRVSTTGRYTAAFTAPTGIFQGDSNTVLLIHFDGVEGQQHTDDWSGTVSFTKDEYFNNDAILETSRKTGAPAGFAGRSHRYYNAADNIEGNIDFIKKEVVYQMRQRYPELVILGTRFTPTNATYDAVTGLLSMTVTGNTFTNGGQFTPQSASYNPSTGILTITKINHGVTNGKRINIKVGGITFTCAEDSNATNHPYPRSTDPVAGKWLTVSNATADTFTVDVGTSSNTTTHAFVSALTNAITVEKDRLKILDNSLTFTCAMDGNTANKTYPRPTDPASKDVALPIVSSSSTNLTVNVGPSPLVNFQPTNATYDPATGAFVMTIANHTINVGTQIRLTANSFTFTCTQDGNSAQKTYPRATAGDGQPDPAYNTALDVTAVGTTTQDISSAAYVPTTGILTVNTSGNHGLSTGNRIQIADNSLTFTCAYDSNATNHTYPRQTDPIRGEWVEVTVVDADTFTIDIGTSSDTSTHSFVSATAGALIKQTGTVTINVGVSAQADQYAHTFVSAATNAVVTGGNYLHTFVSATNNAVIIDEGINCEDDIRDTLNAIIQDLRNGSNNHVWDAASYYVNRTVNPVQIAQIEPAVKETLFAYEKVDDMLQYVITNALWPVQGDHGLTQFTDVSITDSSYTTLNQFTPTNATYNPATGDMVLTIGSHSMTTSSIVNIAVGGITFTCDKDGNDRPTAYPRKTDPAAKAVLAVTAVGGGNTTITVNVGKSSARDQYTHTFVSAVANSVTELNYTTGDCADVYSTVGNLINIITDTITNASASSPVDHLASVTKVEPAYEFVGGTVDGYLETTLAVDYHNAGTDLSYTNQIGPDTQYRFRDAANLIRLNRTAIVDKAAYDMLQRYPTLAQTMPRNQGGASTDGTIRCKTDLGNFLDAIANDLQEGGNLETITGTGFYLFQNGGLRYIRLQVFQSVYAHGRLAEYMKQAVLGTLTDANTNSIVVGDWGVTGAGVSGYFNAVTARIDELIATINNIIAPTGSDFEIAADRLFFNKQFIKEEINGLVLQYLSYVLNGVTYNAGAWNDELDVEDLIVALISDLQAGGTDSTIQEASTYLTAALNIQTIDNVLPAALYAIEQVGILGEYAIENGLFAQAEAGSANSSTQYAAQYTDESAYRDSISTSAINDVVYAWRDLIEIVKDIFSPGGKEARSAAKQLEYNENYYTNELNNAVTNQFGSGAWSTDQENFIEGIVGDIVHDLITTDTYDKSTAYTITLSASSGTFGVGELVTSSNGGEATVLEYDDVNKILYVGAFGGSAWVATNTLSAPSGATGTIASGGVSSAYNWYNNPTNVKIIDRARNLTSNIEGLVSTTNIFPDPENLNATGWTASETTTSVDVTAAPDETQTADKLIASTNNTEHYKYKNFTLNSFETFDSDTTKFDSTTETFDTGSAGDATTQTFTYSIFVKAAEYTKTRIYLALDDSLATRQRAFFDLDLSNGTKGSIFTPDVAITVDAFGVIPHGNGWYRAYITATFGFGFSQLRTQVYTRGSNGALVHAGNGSDGLFVWGHKLNSGALDPYTAASGTLFYSNTDYNIKTFALDNLEDFMGKALDNTLTSPSPLASFYKFYDASLASDYNKSTIQRFIRYHLNVIRNQLAQSTYYTTITNNNAITVPTIKYGNPEVPIGLSGGVKPADYFYGLLSDASAEVETVTENTGEVVQVYKRFRIDGNITDGPFTMGETVAKQGSSGVTGVVYGFYEDANYKYLDVRVTAGVWAVTDNIVGAANSTTAQISAIEDRLHIIDLQGLFENNIPFKGYTSGQTAQPTGFYQNNAAVTDNTGGTLTVDTASLTGTFETTAVVYPQTSRKFIDVKKIDGLDVKVGDLVASTGNIRLGINILNNLNVFTEGNRLYSIVAGQQQTNYVVISEIDLANNYLYVIPVGGFTPSIGDVLGDYGTGTALPVGQIQVTTVVTNTGQGAARVQDIENIGLNKRLYLSSVVGSFTDNDGIKGPDNYASAILNVEDVKARVKRSFRGFDGTQTSFKLTTDNGTQYLPDPAGHMLIFVNGILQPPGATNAYTAFSDTIQFTEAPDLGASFTGFYVGKLRQLDDISFEFDSLSQSFNLKRNDVFYSLTLTDGVQSSTIRPENNIIVSLNGVIQEPGIGFEIVGSRIIFTEVPRFGSTFVAFSYVGSEADVDAAEVVPPIEPGDFIDIQGETADREVAVIESSNSLITFDYLGSVFGQKAVGTAALTTGFIKNVQVTGGGSGYTSRPTVRVDSISGFEGNIRALVGVAGVELSATGSGYQNPSVAVETTVPDDYVAPNLADYGEELIDPEIL